MDSRKTAGYNIFEHGSTFPAETKNRSVKLDVIHFNTLQIELNVSAGESILDALHREGVKNVAYFEEIEEIKGATDGNQ